MNEEGKTFPTNTGINVFHVLIIPSKMYYKYNYVSTTLHRIEIDQATHHTILYI